MNPSTQNDSASSATGEETLRLIAALRAPAGLEDRVKARLENAPRSGRVLFWPSAHAGGGGWVRTSSVRAAAAAAIVFVVVGGGWGVYSRVQPVAEPKVIVMQPRVNGSGGFSSAGAMRTPQTLNGPVLTHPVVEAPAQPQSEDKSNSATSTKKPHRAKTASSKQTPIQSPAH